MFKISVRVKEIQKNVYKNSFSISLLKDTACLKVCAHGKIIARE